jgi:hypothetical protein
MTVNVNQDELIHSLLVERFSKWGPGPPSNDRAEMATYPTVRDGLPFEPIATSVRARKFRLSADASRRNS